MGRQLAGWAMTLGNPELSAVVRADIEAKYAAAKLRVRHLEQRRPPPTRGGATRRGRSTRRRWSTSCTGSARSWRGTTRPWAISS
ncbi:MAG: hypothetical protein WKF75_02545 [Singulisphaera sp.]